MTVTQLLRAMWVRRWMMAAVFAVLALAGTLFAWSQPRAYTAQSLLVLDVRPDPMLGGLGAAVSMSTQIEILKTDKVAQRAVELLGHSSDPKKIELWQQASTDGATLDRFLGSLLQRGLTVGVVQGSNIISLSYSSDDRAEAIRVVNALAKAATEVAVEMRVGPARESADWLGAQTVTLRANLEQAQSALSKFQQQNGIVFSDERMSTELGRLSALETQYSLAQTERIDASGRARSAASSTPQELQRSPLAVSLMTQLAAAEARQGELSLTLGSDHPARLQIDQQVAGIKRQLAEESKRLAEGSTVVSRVSQQKIEEIRSLVEAQKKQVLALRSQRDQAAVLIRDVETAQRAYEGASQRVSQLMLESQNNQPLVRMLSPATDATSSSKRKKLFAVALLGALAAAAAVAIGLEWLDPRVRAADDLSGVAGLPLLGVLRPTGSKQPVYRRLPIAGPLQRRPLTALPGPLK
jgi:uncharacterized protein involved in exopolysaccharide biosynthesis